MKKIPKIKDLKDDILRWIESVRDTSETDSGRFKYNRHMVRPYATEATAHIVFILQQINELHKYPYREGIIKFLLSCQEPSTGLFKDPLITEEDRWQSPEAHSWEHIWAHHTSVCKTALDFCGVSPLYPLPESIHMDFDATDPVEWTRSLDWTRPYYVAEHWYMTVKAYIRKYRRKGDEKKAYPVIEKAFETLEKEIISPETGFPDKYLKSEEEGGRIGGIFKLIITYAETGRPFPYADKLIPSVLALQRPNGDFTGTSNMCMNWDALYIIYYAAGEKPLATKWRSEIVNASRKLAIRLINDYKKEDGGFSFQDKLTLERHNSIYVTPQLPESDALGTALGLECILLNECWHKDIPLPRCLTSYKER